MGGYKIDCQKVAELNMLLRPKARKSTLGEALTRELTIPLRSPAGDLYINLELVLIFLCTGARIATLKFPFYSLVARTVRTGETYIAGASAIKTSTLSFSVGWIDKVANAWALPCEKPIYDNEGCEVVVKI